MNKTVIEKAKQVQIDFGNRLSLARTSRGHTQKTLAEAIGVTQGLISKIERGDQTTSAHNIAFAVELRVNTIWLNSGIGEMNGVDNVTNDSFLTESYLVAFKNIIPLLEALSLIVIHTPLEQKELVKKFRYILSHTARKEFPDASIAELSDKVGMLSGAISDNLDEEIPKVASSNEARILTLLWEVKDEGNMVDLNGENSFYSIATKELMSKHSSDAALNSLLKTSSVEIRGGRLLIKFRRLIVKDDVNETMRILSDVILRFVKTVLWNADIENKDKKKYQNTIMTRGIHPDLIEKVHNEVLNHLKYTTIVEVRRIIESFEKYTDYNYPEYSVSFFESF